MRATERWPVVASGDAVALVLFAVIGLASHHKGLGAHSLVRDAVPVLVGWFAAALVFGAYRRPSVAAFAASWAVGVGGGALVRGMVLGRHVLGARYLTFVGVTLGVTLVFLLAWRGLLKASRLVRRDPVRS